MKRIYKGPDYTYRRLLIKNAFNEKQLLDTIKSFIKKFKEVYEDSAQNISDWIETELGKTLTVDIKIAYPYVINLSLARDGWYIKLLNARNFRRHLSAEECQIVFDDSNQNFVYTTENENVVKIMIQIADKVINSWEKMENK